jgi:hypothetical protein
MILLPPDFKEFLQLLNSNEVEYLLIGGYAVGYYGYPRATADMDIWVNATAENAAKVAAVLGAFGFSEVSPDIFLRERQVIRMGVPPLRIEVLTSISGVSFSECFAESERRHRRNRSEPDQSSSLESQQEGKWKI